MNRFFHLASRGFEILWQLASDSRYRAFYWQRRFTHPALRARFAASAAARIAKHHPAPHLGSELEQPARQLQEDGIAFLPGLLSGQQLSEIRTYLESKSVRDPYAKGSAAFYPKAGSTTGGHVAFHESADVLKAPHLLALANYPALLSLAGATLKCMPTIVYLAAWWSFPTNRGPQQAENFHRDYDDWRFLKFFLYLSDVGPEQGPHVYVRRSVQSEKCRAIRRYVDGEVAVQFSPQDILTLTGAAGTAFIENTFGLHKGLPLKQGQRLIFQVVYGINPLPYGPREPIARTREISTGTLNFVDPWINRIYVKT